MPAIFIGRFQPLHKGHLKAIKWLFKKEKEILIVIGSIDKSSMRNNLFSFSERKNMIERTLSTANIKNYKIYGVKDYSNDIFWAKKVLRMAKLLPKEAIVYTQNPWTADCFKKIKVKVKSHPLFFNRLSATQVRRKIVENKKWENLVPKTVFDFLVKINGEKRIKALPSRATSTKVL
ncbi:MAG: nicotinamide-nucleotide adenylyltransferase [Parcubacteria group bacterium CG_4_9_14_0_2_um_filter_35_11]|nr:MAG: nicotinamide-nucleotide adenylyltransferase [Parcubacteria group bacterium CG07_land_8_20_14_0_80_35_11]PJC47993.1 MAG: nicotinamide-nucleotide adenylyltransferase [Parcubacteria group bacterium CG_4_9_14_0_2_um_filter_35_11]